MCNSVFVPTLGGQVRIYFTKNPNANYGIYGGQVQYNLKNDLENGMAAAIRASFARLFGPEDLNVGVYGIDLIRKQGC